MTPPKDKREQHTKKVQKLVRKALIKRIHNYDERFIWQMTTAGDKGLRTIWAFYNNGTNLYVEPQNMPATTFYEEPWRHLSYSIYGIARRFTSSNGLNHVILQTLGHDRNNSVEVMFGCNPEHHYSIPPLHILYVAIEGEIRVKASLLQFQPLPYRMVPIQPRY